MRIQISFLFLNYLGQKHRNIRKTQISQICTEKSVLICEICVKKLKQSF